MGSNTVSAEGCDPLDTEEQADHSRGYLWQPYGPCDWPHLASIDGDLVAKIAKQRLEWQEQGLIYFLYFLILVIISYSFFWGFTFLLCFRLLVFKKVSSSNFSNLEW